MNIDFKKRVRAAEAFRKQMGKVRIGLPDKVEFTFAHKGMVVSLPKERKWIVMPVDKKTIIHKVRDGDRNDVTKHRARTLLKIAILGRLRDDGASA